VPIDDDATPAGGSPGRPPRRPPRRGHGQPGTPARAAGTERPARPGKLGMTPTGAKEPIGLDRARRRGDAPVRADRARDAPPRPPLPDDEQPNLPRAIVREIERTLGPGPRASDVALALSIGSAAIDEDRPDIAVELLRWAKHEAPRVTAIREAYGVALYLAEEYAEALSELQAYRRLTGRVDQNHLVADCMRALGRDVDRVVETVAALVGDDEVADDRRAEGVIIWAAVLAESGDLGAGRAVLRRFLERPRAGDEPHDLRVRYLAVDLAERQDDPADACRHLESIVAVDEAFLDVPERLASYRDRGLGSD
jgi:hypothetical protein